MDREEIIKRMKFLHNEKLINYTFIANYIGVSRQLLYKWTLPIDDKQHRNLKKDKLDKLIELIEKLEQLN